MNEATAQVFTWVRDGFVEGVPDEDLPSLYSLVRQRLGSDRTLELILTLVAKGLVSAEAAASASSSPAVPSSQDIRRVSARLAFGGWPLGTGSAQDDDGTDPTSYLGRIVAWLREGYPGGVPDHDYIPLLALLERRLTRSEVKKVARALRAAEVSPAGPGDIAAAIEEVTHTDASDADLQRVRDRLSKKGWPVDFPDPL